MLFCDRKPVPQDEVTFRLWLSAGPPAKQLHRRFQQMYGPKTEFGLGGARTYNQGLKRVIVCSYKTLVISVL